jgi:hypothetical protein
VEVVGVLAVVISVSDPTVIRIGHLFIMMVDDNQSREKKANDEKRHQPEREVEGVRNRAGEDQQKQGDPSAQLGDLDEALENQGYPTTTDELVKVYGDYEIETQGGTESLEEVLASTENQTYDSANDVRRRILGLIHR